MSISLVDFIKGQLGAGLVSQLATKLEESETSILKAINGLLPAVFGSLINYSKEEKILDFIGESSQNGLLGNLVKESQSEAIADMISELFADADKIKNSVASFAEIDTHKVHFLLGIVVSATLGAVGKFTTDRQLDKKSIISLLDSQRGEVLGLVPVGLSLESLGLGAFSDVENRNKLQSVDNPQENIGTESKEAVSNFENTPLMEPQEKGVLWKWVVPLILLLYAGWYLFQSTKDNTKNALEQIANVDSLSIKQKEIMSNDSLNTIPLLDGIAFQGAIGAMEQRMIAFLKSGAYTNAINDEELKNNWYNFDKVEFVFGKSDEVTLESIQQLRNIAVILKRFPEVKVKIGGYTDKKGDEATNKELSQVRANFIKQKLTQMGVGHQVVSAEGYGEAFATIDENATEEERAIDRKMAIRFTK